MGVIAAVGGPTSKIKPSSGGEDLLVQVTSAQSREKKTSLFVLVCLTLNCWSPRRKDMINRKKSIYLLKPVQSFLHWSCFYCYLGDFAVLKLGKLNFSAAWCKVLSIKVLCAYALHGNFIHSSSIQLYIVSETVAMSSLYKDWVAFLGVYCRARNRGNQGGLL